MAKKKKKKKNSKAYLAILFVLAGIGLSPGKELKAAGNMEWQDSSESSATAVTAAMNPFDGKGLIDGVIMSSGGTGSPGSIFVEMRDSATANVSYESRHSPIAIVFSSTNTVSVGPIVQFKPPLRIYNGLSVNAVGCTTVSPCYSVQFRRVSD